MRRCDGLSLCWALIYVIGSPFDSQVLSVNAAPFVAGYDFLRSSL